MQTKEAIKAKSQRWTIQNPKRLMIAIACTIPAALALSLAGALTRERLTPDRCLHFEGEELVDVTLGKCQ